jgi:2-hydroxy-3-keto-5-methylthiopentenyl-1-phosphate phosphatase
MKVQKEFLDKATIRPGSKQVFDFCKRFKIPSVIVSAGVKEVIALWSKTFEIDPFSIIATKLIVNSKGEIVDWEKESVIHVLNKRERGHQELTELRKIRPNIILIGDAMEDADMADGDENVLRIRIGRQREDENLTKQEFTSKTFEKFDLMIDSGTLEPVSKLLELIN